MSVLDQKTLISWFASDDTGASSEALAREYAGEAASKSWGYSYPSDPGDLGRCIRLIDKIPAVRASVDTLAAKSKYWKVLAPVWDSLTALYRAENPTGKCPKTYAEMRRVLDAAVDADPRAFRMKGGVTISFGRES